MFIELKVGDLIKFKTLLCLVRNKRGERVGLMIIQLSDGGGLTHLKVGQVLTSSKNVAEDSIMMLREGIGNET